MNSVRAIWWREQETAASLAAIREAERESERKQLLQAISKERDLGRNSWWKSNTCPYCRRSCASREALEIHRRIGCQAHHEQLVAESEVR